MSEVVQVMSLEELQEKQNQIIKDTETDDLSELFEFFEDLEEADTVTEYDFDVYKELSFRSFEKTDRWDNRNYEPTEWELWLKECGTNAY
jgi:hypothetical protein